MSNAPLFLFKDNVSTLLSSLVNAGDASINVTATTGANFPVPSYPTSQLAVTVEDTSGNIEVMYVTGIATDVLSVTRGEEGTPEQNFASGSRVEMRVTSGVLGSFLQKKGGDTLTGSTAVNGVIALGSTGSIQGGEFTGALRGAPAQTGNQVLVSSDSATPATSGGSTILTTANIAAHMPSGYGLVPSQAVIMWSGASNAIPAGYLLCNAANYPTTPNMTDMFPVAAGNLYGLGTQGGVTGTTDAHAATGVTLTPVVLTTANLPSHLHPFDYYFGSGAAVIGIPGYGAPGSYLFAGTGAGTKVSFAGSPNTAGTAAPFTPTMASGGSHTHTFTATSPPYYGIFFIMKS
jgi:hypothetical protein